MSLHTFHIPVMGIAYTIDTPIKVAHYGFDSVISILDDRLIEKVRKVYSIKNGVPYVPIKDQDEDARASRITHYLNLVKKIVNDNIMKFKHSCTLQEAIDYLEMLPDHSAIKRGYLKLKSGTTSEKVIHYARKHVQSGAIDVNIMTKVDKVNYSKNKPLPRIYNDAHASLRGFAQSELNSSVVLSAGLNPSLYGYMSEFDDFYPNQSRSFNKKIILKVSDYRSAMIQGNFLAKKGLWVSEFRIESGLNCGGHAFATEGHLMGPILEEFKNQRKTLQQSMFDIYQVALAEKGYPIPSDVPAMKITAQGGVGTSGEHAFLMNYYELDAVGWGSPFLLVPEATCVDSHTLNLIRDAKEEDLYLSGISPLGVPFHNLRSNTKDQEKQQLAALGKPGSPCVKKHLSFNTEFTEKPICTASKKYQNLKIKELKEKGLEKPDFEKIYEKITEKACICTGLGTSFSIKNELDTKLEGEGVSVCPGPNTAYFDKIVSLKEIVDHIYGRGNIITRKDRPHMFVKELGLYLDQLKNLVDQHLGKDAVRQEKKIQSFIANMMSGITYYKKLVQDQLNLPELETKVFGDFLDTAVEKISEMSNHNNLVVQLAK